MYDMFLRHSQHSCNSHYILFHMYMLHLLPVMVLCSIIFRHNDSVQFVLGHVIEDYARVEVPSFCNPEGFHN